MNEAFTVWINMGVVINDKIFIWGGVTLNKKQHLKNIEEHEEHWSKHGDRFHQQPQTLHGHIPLFLVRHFIGNVRQFWFIYAVWGSRCFAYASAYISDHLFLLLPCCVFRHSVLFQRCVIAPPVYLWKRKKGGKFSNGRERVKYFF